MRQHSREYDTTGGLLTPHEQYLSLAFSLAPLLGHLPDHLVQRAARMSPDRHERCVGLDEDIMLATEREEGGQVGRQRIGVEFDLVDGRWKLVTLSAYLSLTKGLSLGGRAS